MAPPEVLPWFSPVWDVRLPRALTGDHLEEWNSKNEEKKKVIADFKVCYQELIFRYKCIRAILKQSIEE